MIDLPAADIPALEKAGGGTYVVDFWAPWCGSCRLLAPAVQAIAGEKASQATFAQVDVDAYPDVAERFGVMSVPTILVLRDGVEIGRSQGMKSQSQLRSELSELID